MVQAPPTIHAVGEMSGSERSGTVGGCRARVLAVDDQPPFLALLRAVERHINSIFSKLGLGESESFSRRVKAALLYLAGQAG